jgi:hypothetical protein
LTPKRPVTAQPAGPKSSADDEMDDIYKETDPIDTSLAKRKKAGALASVVPDKSAKQGKFFFDLKLKGDIPPFTEEQKLNVARLSGKVDESGQMIEETKPQIDPIDKAL